MFCPGCGTQRNPAEAHMPCACGHVAQEAGGHTPPPPPGYGAPPPGSPPPPGYGAPPPGSPPPSGYGAPPQGGYPPPPQGYPGHYPYPPRPSIEIGKYFTLNQFIMLGGCLLLLIFLALPFESIAQGVNLGWGLGSVRVRSSVSGYSMMFGLGLAQGEGLFSMFLDLFVPILGLVTVVLLSSFKIIKANWIVLSVAAAGCYMSLSTLIFIGRIASFQGSNIGVGLILLFITWLVVSAAAVLNFLNIHLVKLKGQA